MENFQLIDGSFIDYSFIDSLHFNELKNRSTYFKIEEKFTTPHTKVFSMDNCAVLQMGEDFMMFRTLEEVEKVLHDHQILANGGGVEILLNKNPFGSNFPKHTKDEVVKFLSLLNLKERALNRALLEDIDKIIDVQPNRNFIKENFFSLICLIGEVIISDSDAQWDMILSSDGVTWNPHLSNGTEKSQFFTDLYEMIFIEQGNVGVLTTIYDSYIVNFR